MAGNKRRHLIRGGPEQEDASTLQLGEGTAYDQRDFG